MNYWPYISVLSIYFHLIDSTAGDFEDSVSMCVCFVIGGGCSNFILEIGHIGMQNIWIGVANNYGLSSRIELSYRRVKLSK